MLPLVACAPLQLPDAAQLVALTEDQVSVLDPPTTTDAADRVRVGAAGTACAVTVNVTELAGDIPAALLHVSE